MTPPPRFFCRFELDKFGYFVTQFLGDLTFLDEILTMTPTLFFCCFELPVFRMAFWIVAACDPHRVFLVANVVKKLLQIIQMGVVIRLKFKAETPTQTRINRKRTSINIAGSSEWFCCLWNKWKNTSIYIDECSSYIEIYGWHPHPVFLQSYVVKSKIEEM